MRFSAGLDVPEGWRTLPLKRVASFGYGDALANDDRQQGQVKVYGSNGPFDQHSSANTLAPCIIVGRKGSYGKLQFSEEPVFAVDTAFVIDRRHTTADLRFLYYVLGILGLDELSDDTAVPGLSRAKAYQAICPLPPASTQERIADFLDERTARIDGLIARKERLLELLAEKRQALITRAVTKGLDPDAPMKPSGISWLGDIPAHWEVKRLKHICPTITVGIVVTPAAYYADEGPIALRGTNIREMGFSFDDLRFLSESGHAVHPKSQLKTGDLVVVRTGMPGTTAVIDERLDNANCVDLVIIKSVPSFNSRYFGWYLNSDAAKAQYRLGSAGALQVHFNVEACKSVLIPLPPKKEQEDIAQLTDQHVVRIETTTSRVQLSVDLLRQYRSALITAAVTGQLDVTEEAA